MFKLWVIIFFFFYHGRNEDCNQHDPITLQKTVVREISGCNMNVKLDRWQHFPTQPRNSELSKNASRKRKKWTANTVRRKERRVLLFSPQKYGIWAQIVSDFGEIFLSYVRLEENKNKTHTKSAILSSRNHFHGYNGCW